MSTREIDDDCTGDDCKNKWYTAAEIKDKIVVATNDKTKYEGFEFDLTDLKKLVSKLESYNAQVVSSHPEQVCTGIRFWVSDINLFDSESSKPTIMQDIVTKNLVALPINSYGDDLHALQNAEINTHKVETNPNGVLRENLTENQEQSNTLVYRDLILSKARPCPNACGSKWPPRKFLRD
ncbi:MAG: hypothetical protein ACPGU5_02645 [Lishizhenia sp.]